MNTNPNDKDFDWFAFLGQPCRNMSKEDLEDAHDLASDWPTCACGQLCRALPRSIAGEPYDDQFHRLGMDFLSEIINMKLMDSECDKESCRKNAIAIFKRIEERTIELLTK